MAGWQATVLIVEQAIVLLALVWFGVRFGQWTASRERATESTLALITELQQHRKDPATHVATFVHEDREEIA